MKSDQKYQWEAVDPSAPAKKQRKKGTMYAFQESEVSSSLQADGLIPISVKAHKSSFSNFELTPSEDSKVAKLANDQVVAFARMFYLLLRSGLTQPKALVILGEDAPIPIQKMCRDLSERMLAGQPLSEAMEAYPKAFDDVFKGYVSAGEATGNMVDAMQRLAKMLDNGYQLRLKVKAVTAYPKMVSYAILVMTWGIMTFLVPRFGAIYSDLGQELPAPTRILISASSYMSPIHVNWGIPPDFTPEPHSLLTAPINFLSPVFWILALVFGFKKWKKNNSENLELMTKLDKWKFKIPVMGKLLKYNMTYRWSATMAGAMSAGLQAQDALGLAGRTAGSPWMKLVTIGLQDAIRSGRTLSSELAKHPDLFSAQLRAMAATGEEAGEQAEMFENVAFTLSDEIEAMIATLGAKIEVLLLMVMGAVVGGLLVVLYMPILNLTQAASKGLGE